ncbi:Anaerobic ribonucleoside-triphosphate reductase activating protein [Elusimicrobium minutum Pei191]|uniref:Anaerobic ribonucleoside-triphosphate reductase activating protein n=1 Tax=Elusimicrobium minutum (strain Pei191) TaxID=445932 RepID=B2KDZ2_ELUMP|nr:anaerobic ribonucleoside-triphosphate reductase activating protein [Elusimicrobium minutum]ACC98738.1 Anaerobic ribonucleoside-triphosphate reductase activating protein [Elusimicrobium minutum Pei191]
MKIGGLIKTSLVDYPGLVSAVIFMQGCNMRCPYCHNPELVYPNMLLEPYNEDEVFAFLEKRKGALDGVVVTGGEPAVHADLPEFLAKIKALGYKVKLDTNGTMPDMIEKILKKGLIDSIAMDIKAPFSKYNEAAGVAVNIEDISKSMALIVASGIDYEFRTTYDKSILTEIDIKEIIKNVPDEKHFTLQECIPLNGEKDILKVQK